MWAAIEQVARRMGLTRGNQGPWADWDDLISSRSWQQGTIDYADGLRPIEVALKGKNINNLIEKGSLTQMQQANLMQVLYALQKAPFKKL